MSGKHVITLALGFAILASAIYLLSVRPAQAPVEEGVGLPAPAGVQNAGGRAGIANPASTNCVKLGGTLEIAEGEGGQYGLCHLPDGRVCEEWALFRDNECTVP
jgi:putative hemolysin